MIADYIDQFIMFCAGLWMSGGFASCCPIAGHNGVAFHDNTQIIGYSHYRRRPCVSLIRRSAEPAISRFRISFYSQSLMVGGGQHRLRDSVSLFRLRNEFGRKAKGFIGFVYGWRSPQP